MSRDTRESRDVLRGPAGTNDRRVYVGNLPPDVMEREIKDIFDRYGHILDVDLKVRRDSYDRRDGRGAGRSPFAFVEFEDRRGAEDAVDERDGYNYDGYKLRVEFPRGGGRGGFRGGFDRGGGGGGRGRGPPRRSSYKIYVSGLPSTGSWQDLKDHMREAGEVCYADVDKNGGGTGVVEFQHKDDMKYAIKNLDDTKFKSHEGETSYIRLSGGRSHSRSRSRSPQRRRRSYTRSRSRSRD